MDYRFLEKDPAIDVVRSAYLESNAMLPQVAAEARVHPRTIYNWLYGKTKKPQGLTLMKVLAALGVTVNYTWGFTGRSVEIPTGIAAKFRHKAKAKKRRK